MTLTNTGDESPTNRATPQFVEAGEPYRFKKGQSGNPNGRPKKIQEAEDKLLENLLKAANKLGEHIGSEDPRVSLQASVQVLERVMGKAVQKVEQKNIDPSPKEMDLDELEQAYREATAQGDDQAQEGKEASH